MPSKTADTKTRILDVAEGLFAEHGFAGTSLRAITSQAKVNLAAVNYHFRSKDALIEAVFARRLLPMNADRLRRLDVLEQQADTEIALAKLIEVFVRPALELSRDQTQGGKRFIQLLGRSYTEPSPVLQEAVRAMYETVIERFKLAFARALPHLTVDELYWRMHFLVGVLAYCMAGTDLMRLIASCRIPEGLDIDTLTRRMTGFLEAAMRAPADTQSDVLPAATPVVSEQKIKYA